MQQGVAENKCNLFVGFSYNKIVARRSSRLLRPYETAPTKGLQNTPSAYSGHNNFVKITEAQVTVTSSVKRMGLVPVSVANHSR